MQDKSEFEKKYNVQPTESLLDKYNVQRLNSVNEEDTSFVVTNETGNQSLICKELLPDKLGRIYYSVHYENKLTGEYKCVASRVAKYTCEKYVEKCFVEEHAGQDNEQDSEQDNVQVAEVETAEPKPNCFDVIKKAVQEAIDDPQTEHYKHYANHVETVETVEVAETPESVWNGKTFAELAAEQAEPNKDRDEQLTVTHSSMHCFMGCRQKYDYRYNRHIVPKEKIAALTFGSAVHAGLEYWFKTGIVQAAVDAAGAVDGLDESNRIKAQALVRKYTEVYADEPFKVLEIEHTFTQRARHPRTNKLSKRITYTGKIDGLIEMDGELWILEHKTATVADDAYFDCKDFDDQIALYAIAMSDELGKPVVGALYDVILKPQLRMCKGETDDEYAARVAASKTGKIKRKEAETVEQFAERVGNAVTEFNYMRRWIRFDPLDLIRKKAAFWSASHDMANGDIYQNTCACNSGYGACEYRHLCKARGDLGKCAEYYETRAPHEELSDKGSAE